MDNKTSPQQYHDGFRYPREDARLHNGDKVQLSSTSHKTWLFIHTDPASPFFKTLGQTSDPNLAATFAIERPSISSPIVRLWCMGQRSYLSVRAADSAVGCFSPNPMDFTYVRIDGQKWWDASRGSLQDPSTGRFARTEDPATAGAGVNMLGSDTSGWQLFSVQLIAGYEMVYPLVRGVNLGNWFVLERWMSSELFADESGQQFTDRCAALDERGLMQRLRPETRRARMEKHWSSWVTEQDIRWLADSGINTVRVPFGYWMTHPEPPFIAGQFVYLKSLFQWCKKYSISILLDFHGLKGSQNGADSSGNCGACGQQGCGVTYRRFLEAQERTVNLEVIANLSATFGHEPALLGFGLANEVGKCDRYDLMSFYQMASDIIRASSPAALVIVGGLFSPSTYPFLREEGMVQDEHMYFSVISSGATADQRGNLDVARKYLSGQPRWPVLIGEWSIDHHGFDLGQLTLSEQERWLQNFARAQLQAYEQHTMGWIYWSYKVGVEVTSTWSFSAMCKKGFLPGCVSGFEYGPSDWWATPPASYLDRGQEGMAGVVTVGPYVVSKGGTNACPAGSASLTEEECRQMPKEFGGALHEPFKEKYSSDPKGCFKFQENYYYNEHPVGTAREGRLPHCKLVCAKEKEYIAGQNGANSCPLGTEALDEAECRDVVKDYGSSLFGGSVRNPELPAGCFRFGARVYFNSDVKGSSKAGRTPYCRQTCVISYVLGEEGSNTCLPGSAALSESECERAVGLLGPPEGPFVESNRDDPTGCFQYTDKGFYYNKDPIGSPRGKRTPVCKLVDAGSRSSGPGGVAAASPRQRPRSSTATSNGHYFAGEPGSNGCPPGSSPLAEQECRGMPEEFDGQLNSPFAEDLPDDPKGCFSFEHGFYFNRHAVGSPRESRVPFCKNHSTLAVRSSRLRGPALAPATLPVRSAVATVAAGAALSRYMEGDSGTNGCPSDSAVLDETECWQIPKEFGPAGTPPSIFVEELPEDPRGCFKFGDGFYYNKHPVGSPRLGRKPFCKRSTAAGPRQESLPQPKLEAFTSEGKTIHGSYVAGNDGSNSCPPNALSLSEMECRTLPQEFPGKLHDPFVEYLADDPTGCFKFEHGFYFNKHPIGTPRSGRTPYCKQPSTTVFE